MPAGPYQAKVSKANLAPNHLAQLLFTCLLAPSLVPRARLEWLTWFFTHHEGAVNFEDPNYETTPYHKWVAYGASKTANALFAVGLNARLQSKGVLSYGVHPGMIATGLGRHLVPEDYALFAAAPESLLKLEPPGRCNQRVGRDGTRTSR